MHILSPTKPKPFSLISLSHKIWKLTKLSSFWEFYDGSVYCVLYCYIVSVQLLQQKCTIFSTLVKCLPVN